MDRQRFLVERAEFKMICPGESVLGRRRTLALPLLLKIGSC